MGALCNTREGPRWSLIVKHVCNKCEFHNTITCDEEGNKQNGPNLAFLSKLWRICAPNHWGPQWLFYFCFWGPESTTISGPRTNNKDQSIKVGREGHCWLLLHILCNGTNVRLLLILTLFFDLRPSTCPLKLLTSLSKSAWRTFCLASLENKVLKEPFKNNKIRWRYLHFLMIPGELLKLLFPLIRVFRGWGILSVTIDHLWPLGCRPLECTGNLKW